MLRWLIGTLVLTVMAAMAPGSQADFVVANGETVLVTQFLADNQTGLIQPGGTIMTPGNGVDAGSNNTITNAGTISTLGPGGIGINALAGNAITNSGLISTASIGASAIFIGGFVRGSSNTVLNAGTISTTGANAFGIVAPSDNNRLVNAGLITTTGVAAHGIVAFGNSNLTENRGTISTLGVRAAGIFYDIGSNSTVLNMGSITAQGQDAWGIRVRDNSAVFNHGAIATFGPGGLGIEGGDNNTIFNHGTISSIGNGAHGIQGTNNNTIGTSGTITTSGLGAAGIWIDGNNNLVAQSGVISTAGVVGSGIVLNGDSNTVRNSGTIETRGSAAHGVFAFGDGNTVVNEGSILANGTNAVGVFDVGNNTTVINSGLISATGPGAVVNAVRFTGTGNTLRLLPGSVLVGPVTFNQPGNNLDIANGLSINNTFTGNTPRVIANGAPSAVNGLEVAVVDPTALAIADDIIFDLTNSVSGSVFSRLRSERLGGSTGQVVALLQEDDGLGFASSMDTGTEAWVEVFGLAREQRDTSPAVGADHYLGGIVTGVDTPIGADARAGLFLGASYGNLDVKFGSQDEDIGSAFIGAYGGYASGPWAIDLVVTGGWSRYNLSRNIANNTAPGGMETASAEHDGFFIAPELSVAHTASINGQEVIPSVQLGYAGTHLDGYTETGSSSTMSVDDRFIHLLTGRFQVTVPVRIPQNADTIYFAPYAGIEGRTRLDNSDVDAVLLGQTISFDPGGEDSVGAALAGFELSALVDDGVSLFGRVEATVESNSGRTIAGQAGLQIAF